MAYSFIAQAASTELVVVPDFAGDKHQFEYWLQQVQFYLTSTRLIDGSEEALKHFLFSFETWFTSSCNYFYGKKKKK
ncbi:MAG: hypothetical protein GY861_28230 [bacterium]|nr:hypothetical protein [bacterium]